MLARHAVLLTAPEAEPRLLRLASCTILLQRKFFSCNTYGFPRKCCKQKTYGMAKSFRCNTYKKQGGPRPSTFRRPALRTLRPSPSSCPAFLSSRITVYGSRITLPHRDLSQASNRQTLQPSNEWSITSPATLSPHGSPTPRTTLPRRSSLARGDRARHSRFAAFHCPAPAGRSTLLDRNWLWSRRNVPASPRHRRSRPRHRNRSGFPPRPAPPRKTIPQSHRRPRRHSQSRPRRHRFRPPHPHLRQSSLLHHPPDPSSPVQLRRPHRRNTHRHSDRSGPPPGRPTGHARLWLSFRRHPVLHAPRIRLRNSSRRFQPAAGSHFRPRHAPPAR